jgi:uncharacterized protein YndB with AHSA1/START domain
MTENRIVIEADRTRVFRVLLDPTSYPDWLVGAQAIRSVDPAWPERGARFHHRIGVGPLTVPGSTTVQHVEDDVELRLGAGMGPLGEATVRFRLRDDPDGTEVAVEEAPANGPFRVVWRVAAPVLRVGLWGRNAVSLAALRAAVLRSGPEDATAGAEDPG